MDLTTKNQLYVGVDLSKRRLDIFVHPTKDSWSSTNDQTGIDALVDLLRQARPTLVVLEATGGFERPAAGALVAAGLSVAVVNPRQAREFARATGKLAKTDRIDAEVLAHFAQAVRPTPKALPDEEARELSAILARRRQLVEMLVAEKNRLHAITTKPVSKRIEAHIQWLEKELKRTDEDLDEAVRESPTWRENEALLRSVPGVGPVLARTLLAESYPGAW